MEHGDQENQKIMAVTQEKKGRIDIIYTNADCLTNKMIELEDRVKIRWPGVIAVNEVKAKNMGGKELKISEFSLIYQISMSYLETI